MCFADPLQIQISEALALHFVVAFETQALHLLPLKCLRNPHILEQMNIDQRSDGGLYLQNSVSVVNLAYLADVVCLVTFLAVHVPRGQP